jgi:hypothetical protein
MDEYRALEILKLPIKHTGLTYTAVRKAYLKASLKYHPDKSKDNGEKFKEVAEAYRYLMDNCNIYEMKDKSTVKTEENYDNILEEFICKFYPAYAENTWSKIFIKTTIKTIIQKCENVSFKVFENMQKETCKEIYDFMTNIHDLGLINQSLLDKMTQIVKEKYKNDNIILLEPSLEDLLKDKIFKLDISDNTYYVPLWHNELVFDFNFENEIHDLIVKIEPELPGNIFIDHNNNIFIKEKMILDDVFKDGGYKYTLPNNREVFIEADKINMSNKTQLFKYDDIGILKMNEDNMFQSDKRGSIIFELILENKKYNM